MYVPGENTQHNEHNALQVLTDVFWTKAQMWHDDVTHTLWPEFSRFCSNIMRYFCLLNELKSDLNTLETLIKKMALLNSCNIKMALIEILNKVEIV